MSAVTVGTETTAPSPVPLRWLGVLALLTAVAPLSIDMYLPAFPAMAAEFGTSADADDVHGGMGLGQLFIGPRSDRFGRRRLMLAGTLVCIAAGAACALAPNIAFLTGFRFLQGFSGATGVVLSRAVISDRARGATAALLQHHDDHQRCRPGGGAVNRWIRRRLHRMAWDVLNPQRARGGEVPRSDFHTGGNASAWAQDHWRTPRHDA